MRHQFDEAKATQAAARFLRHANGRMNYMVLIKLLYLLDRRSLLKWDRPSIFDDYFSMFDGPIVSQVHDLITEMPWPQELNLWIKFISAPSNYEVTLIGDPGNSQLSEAEEELIDELFAEYGREEPFDLVDRLHKELPEWTPVERGERARITVADILRAGKKSPEEIRAIEGELYSLQQVHSFLASR
jgi:Protein of unknown function (DUF4065)